MCKRIFIETAYELQLEDENKSTLTNPKHYIYLVVIFKTEIKQSLSQVTLLARQRLSRYRLDLNIRPMFASLYIY